MNVLTDPAGRITAVAGALLVAALAVSLGDGGDTLPLALLGAGTVFALFVLVPWALTRISRQPVLLVGAAVAAVPFALIVFFGSFADGRTLWAMPELVLRPDAARDHRARGARRPDLDRRRPAHPLRARAAWPHAVAAADGHGGQHRCRRPGERSVDLRWWAWL